jgi:peptidoglycan/LPS O-acetylase OafA/YrhL
MMSSRACGIVLSHVTRGDVSRQATIHDSGNPLVPFYLVHVLIIQSFVALVPGVYQKPSVVVSIVHVIGLLAIALVAAALLHRLVEIPGRRFLLGWMRSVRTVNPSSARRADPSGRQHASEVPVS